MLDFILAAANFPFAAAIALMLLIGLFEGMGVLLGIGIGSVLDSLIPDFELKAHAEVGDLASQGALSRLLGWLRIGKVPILMLLIVFLVAFGAIGLLINFLALSSFRFMLPTMMAAPAAFALAIPATRLGAVVLEALMPRDETSSVSLDSLVGREAFITLGKAGNEQPAEARIRDLHGATHYVMVVAEQHHGPFGPGVPLLVVRREGNQFVVIKA